MHQNELSLEQIKTVRQWITVSKLVMMEKWFKEEIYKVAPKSAIVKAFAYSLRLWYHLKRYVEDVRFQIDNNPVENSIRQVALGRKKD